MHYIIEVPHRGNPKLWTANGVSDLIEKIERTNHSETLYEELTVSDILENSECKSLDEFKAYAEKNNLWNVYEIIKEQGEGVIFYSGWFNNYEYTTEKPDLLWDVYMPFNGHDLQTQFFLNDIDEVKRAVAEAKDHAYRIPEVRTILESIIEAYEHD